ncbi:transposase [Mariniflexile litorale]|uniref:Transposase n=1 Tax=Mariniflexile litorale TaxID=3045158 RepID=A0AAU7EBF1_9FLAO
MSQLSVDTGHHVITDIKAYHADAKDSQYLPDICDRLEKRLHKHGLLWHHCIADTGYSSGENYAYLEAKGLQSYIPPHGTYKGGTEGLNMTRRRIIMYVHRVKSSLLKRFFMKG